MGGEFISFILVKCIFLRNLIIIFIKCIFICLEIMNSNYENYLDILVIVIIFFCVYMFFFEVWFMMEIDES